jgi:hypothetical protein
MGYMRKRSEAEHMCIYLTRRLHDILIAGETGAC